MAYTVKQLAQLAGVSVRTLHHYDEIGLLLPPDIGANGYRLYNQASVVRLQSILFYRDLDFPLEKIRQVLEGEGSDPQTALRHQLATLKTEAARLRKLQSAIEATLKQLEQTINMNDHRLFAHLTATEETAFTEEASARWDPTVVKASQQRWNRFSSARQAEIKAEGNAVYDDLVRAMPLGPTSHSAQACVERWRRHMAHFWTPNDRQCLELTKLYVEEPRFRANFDRLHPELAEFLRAAVQAHLARRIAKTST